MKTLFTKLAFVMLVAFASIASAQVQQTIITPRRVPTYILEAGAITTGGTWQQVAPQNLVRTRFFLQNYCSATNQGIAMPESIYIIVSPVQPTNPPTSSSVGALEVSSCGVYDSSGFLVATDPVWVYAATTGHKFAAFEW